MSQPSAENQQDALGDKERSQVRTIAAAVVLLSILLAISNSLLNPLFEPPDELQHYQFVRQLIEKRRLPVQSVDEPISQAHQPPLYYLFGALLTSPIADTGIPARNAHWTSYRPGLVHRDNKNQFLPGETFSFPYTGTALAARILRIWSILLMAGTLLVIWLLGRELWPSDPWKQLLLLAIVALLPMYLYLGSSVNNDNLVILLGALMLLLTARALKNGFSWTTTVLIGLVWGLAMLSKITGLLLLAPWSLGLIWYCIKHRSWPTFLSRGAVIAGIALALSGWWFYRNYRLYGEFFGLEPMLDIWGERSLSSFDQLALGGMLSYLWTNFWGRFGYGQVMLPRAIYWLFTALAIAAVIGLLLLLREKRKNQTLAQVRGIWWVFGVTCAMYLFALAYYISRSPTGANSRYMFPMLPALGALLVAGLAMLTRSRRAALMTIVLLAVLAIFSVGVFVPWTYAAPRKTTVQSAMKRVTAGNELVWDNSIRLLGTRVEPTSLTSGPGAEVTLTACWQAEARPSKDYTIFVHLLDHELDSLGQRDMHTGLGNYPTGLWQPGDVFCDRYRIPLIEATILAPELAMVELGFYDGDSREQLQAQTVDGQPVDFAVVEQVLIRPESIRPPSEPNVRLNVADFEQGVVLTGYTWSKATAGPGDEIVTRLWWTAGGPLDSDYQVFAHLLHENGELIAQADGAPRDGVFPTSYWQSGDVIVDERRFVIPDEAPDGKTTLRLGFYRLEDGSRLGRLPGASSPDAVEIEGPRINN
jgi:4-amino-4-deoxy-L-arabinose transferase-like glycosyltransferase